MTEPGASSIKPLGGSGRAVPPRHTRAARLRRALPLATLGLSLSCVFWFGGATAHLYGNHIHAWNTARWMALAENLEFASGLQFTQRNRDADGSIRYDMYNRFPIGGTALVKLVIWPFQGDMSAQLAAARMLMLAFFCGSALLAYSALFRLVGSRPIALAATLLAFASYYMLAYNDVVNNEVGMDVFALLLVFHAMVLFRGSAAAGRAGKAGTGVALSKRRFAWLLATVCVALLLGWHVFGLLAAFAMVGLAGEARAAWRRHAPAASRRRLVPRLGVVALAMLRSRVTLLAVFSVLFGASALGCNLAVEHAHMAGPAGPTLEDAEDTGVGSVYALPAWQAVLRRTGLGDGLEGLLPPVGWDPFWKWQFHRVGVMVVPVAATGIGGLALANEWDWKHAETPPLTGLGIGATAVCFAGLFLRGRRPERCAGRGLLAVLALSGFCWSIPMHRNTVWATHDFEACMYIGMALVFFALLGVGVRHVWRAATGAPVPGVAAVAGASVAALIFAGSSYRMAQDAAWRPDAAQPAVLSEFETIRALARGKDVLVAATRFELGARPTPADGGVAAGMLAPQSTWWYLASAVLHYAPALTDAARVEARGGIDFVLTFERVDAPLLTPAHRFAFLYDAGGVADAIADARRRSHDAIAAREPLARGAFDLHLLPVAPHARASATRGARGGDLALAYLKRPCRPEDLHGIFFLEVTPVHVADLPPLLRRAGRHFVRFKPGDYFGLFEDTCLFRKPLPPYPVRSIRTGRLVWGDRPGWEVEVRIDLHNLRRDRDVVGGPAPAGRGVFDVHLRGRTLTYVRASCAAGADTADRFFLHVTPARPGRCCATGRRGFANLDFDFHEHGARFNGDCVATRTLPDYEIARVATGQFDSSGTIRWQVTFGTGSGFR